MQAFLPAIFKYRLKPVLLKNMPYGINYKRINILQSPCRRFAVSPTVSGIASQRRRIQESRAGMPELLTRRYGFLFGFRTPHYLRIDSARENPHVPVAVALGDKAVRRNKESVGLFLFEKLVEIMAEFDSFVEIKTCPYFFNEPVGFSVLEGYVVARPFLVRFV
jgi:hypothetical protein